MVSSIWSFRLGWPSQRWCLQRKEEDALFCERIETDKAKNLQAGLEQRLSNLKGELASVEVL